MERALAQAIEQEVPVTPGVTPVLECRNLSISYFTRSG